MSRPVLDVMGTGCNAKRWIHGKVLPMWGVNECGVCPPRKCSTIGCRPAPVENKTENRMWVSVCVHLPLWQGQKKLFPMDMDVWQKSVVP